MNKPVYNISPFTLLDYPDHAACIIWFAGCNMRCRYCYNVDIVRGKGNLDYRHVLDFLDSRRGLLEGVVLSGGECTAHKSLEGFIGEIKKLNYRVKIDTNGSHPDRLKSLIQSSMIDYVALDFKALKNRFYTVTQSALFTKFEQSLDLLCHSAIPFEIRTTIHSGLFSFEIICNMIRYLEEKNYRGVYYLQNFFNDCKTIGDVGNDFHKIRNGDFTSEKFRIMVRNG